MAKFLFDLLRDVVHVTLLFTLYDKLLNAKDYGVPQSRRRMIVIGIRNDIEKKYVFPKTTHSEENYVTVGQALFDNPINQKNPNHIIGKITDLNLKRIKHIPEGGSMKSCPPNLQNNSEYSFFL